MRLDDRPYWRPRDLAKLLQTSPSHVYRLVESGAIEHQRVGARTIRIPSRAVAALLSVEARQLADDDTTGTAARARRFVARTRMTPEQFVVAWRQGQIDDTPGSAIDVIDAITLREARRSEATGAP